MPRNSARSLNRERASQDMNDTKNTCCSWNLFRKKDQEELEDMIEEGEMTEKNCCR